MAFGKRDVNYIGKALIIALVVMMVLFAIKPFLDPRFHDITEEMKQIDTIRADQLPVLLQRPDGKPAMLVIYASWCPYCHRMMPYLTEMKQRKVFGPFAPLFVSTDSEPYDLAEYMVHREYASLYRPYRLENTDDLAAVLQKLGGHYEGVPYVAFFDAKGALIAQSSGYAEKARFTAFLQEAAAKISSSH